MLKQNVVMVGVIMTICLLTGIQATGAENNLWLKFDFENKLEPSGGSFMDNPGKKTLVGPEVKIRCSQEWKRYFV